MLTDIKLRTLKSADSLYCVADAKGLTVEIPPAGAPRWRLQYRFAGKAKMLSLGTYPDVKLKMKSAHLVPLSKQAVALLRELFEITGRGNFVFPGVLSSTRPISENTVNSALRRLGYGNEGMTGTVSARWRRRS